MRKFFFATCICLFLCLQNFGYTQNIEYGFSPGNAEELIIKTIDSAHSSIRMAAYSFTSPQIIKRLIDAKKRGVDIKIVVDYAGNKSAASTAAMNLMVNSGIPLRTISKYKIHHDKYMVIDGKHVETGSFNYSQAAAKSNSENIIVIKDDVKTAKAFLKHWNSRWIQGLEWQSNY